MSRADRRRHEREQRKADQRKPRMMLVGDNVVATELGQQYEASVGRDLPPKVPGEHRWIVAASWVVTDPGMVRDAYDPDRIKLLDNENLMMLTIGCWDCEMPLGDPARGGIEHDSLCTAVGDD